jgi:protein TonB
VGANAIPSRGTVVGTIVMLVVATPSMAQTSVCPLGEPPLPSEMVSSLDPSQPPPQSVLTYRPKPNYPSEAQKKKIEGDVVIQVSVSPDGRPEVATVLESSGHAMLDEAARAGIKRWCFSPHSTAYMVRYPFKFVLSGPPPGNIQTRRVGVKPPAE